MYGNNRVMNGRTLYYPKSRSCGLVEGATGGERAVVLEAGGAGDRISCAGPGKTERELEAALTAGVTVNLESDGEFSRLLALGERAGRRPRVAVRVNPD